MVEQQSLELDAPPNEMIHVGSKQPSGALADFRAAMFSLPVETMQLALSEYDERRKCFRTWLLSKLKEGVHYGYPPTLQPKWCDMQGKPCDKKIATATIGFKNAIVPRNQWEPKPSLYKAGADLICDTLGVRDDYVADMETWEQMGKPSGTIVRRCVLSSRADNKELGFGVGARLLGQKGGDANNSVKMADKAAKVCAVINTYGLSDLFTQDIERPPQPLHQNPDQNPNAPQAPPRDERVTAEEVTALGSRWKALNSQSGTLEGWIEFVRQNTGRSFNVKKWSEWTREDYRAVDNRLALEEG